MVAKIKSGKSLIGALNYNENKVKQGKAQLIALAGYPKDMGELDFYDKLLRLTDLAGRNQRTKTNAVHISLNFPNGEALPTEILEAISADYMNGIGFGTQPYLVYRHQDAGHPHIHIVTTNIQPNGQRISLHYLGQDKSEKIRKQIEIDYRLTKAEERHNQQPDLKIKTEVAEYGKSETKHAITNILEQTLRTYKFTSVPELNAVLQQYHIMADQGSKDSRMHVRGGLVYWITDEKGRKLGVPIKASSIYGKPTLTALTEKFKLNETLRKPHKAALLTKVDQALKQNSRSAFAAHLNQNDVQVIFRQNEEGRLYGVTYIDQQTQCVFNGSDLGKAYSANALSNHFLPEPKAPSQDAQASTTTIYEQSTAGDQGDGLLDILFKPERGDDAALAKFKKKRKGLNL